jgi:hypothetical protein
MRTGGPNWLLVMSTCLFLIGAGLIFAGWGEVSLMNAQPLDLQIYGCLILMFAWLFDWSAKWIYIECPKCGYKGEQNPEDE